MSNETQKLTIVLNKGVNRDYAPGTLAEGYASDARHMRFDDEVVFKMPGIANYYATAQATNVNGLFSFVGADTHTHVLRGGTNKLYKIEFGILTEYTATSGPGGRFSFAPWGNTMLLTANLGVNQKLVSPYEAANLTNMTTDTNCPRGHVIRVFQRHVFILNQYSYPFRVSWSDIDDYTDWTATATNEAGSIDLYESKTAVVGGDTLRMLFVVYTGSQIHTFQYVGGTYVFARQVADYRVGLLAKELLVSIGEAQIFMSPTDFYVFDGTQAYPIGKGIRREIYAAMAHAQASHSADIQWAFAFQVQDKNEVWFCVQTEHQYADLACIYNYSNGSWSLEDFPTGYQALAGCGHGATTYPLVALTDNKIYSIGSGEDVAIHGLAVSAYTGYIDSPEYDGGDPESVKHITSLIPDITSTAGTVGFQIGTRDTRNSTVDWTVVYPFDPDVDRHIDVRASGRLVRLRVITSALNSPFRVNKITVCYLVMGAR